MAFDYEKFRQRREDVEFIAEGAQDIDARMLMLYSNSEFLFRQGAKLLIDVYRVKAAGQDNSELNELIDNSYTPGTGISDSSTL